MNIRIAIWQMTKQQGDNMGKLNGDAKVIVERIDNLKEFTKNEFDKNREDHQSVFKMLTIHEKKIAKNDVYIKVGGCIIVIIIGVLVKLTIGG